MLPCCIDFSAIDPVYISDFMKFDIDNCSEKIKKIDIFKKEEWINSNDLERLKLLEEKSEFVFYHEEFKFCIIHCPKIYKFENLIFIIHLENNKFIYQQTYMIARSGLDNYEKEQIVFNNLNELISYIFFVKRYQNFETDRIGHADIKNEIKITNETEICINRNNSNIENNNNEANDFYNSNEIYINNIEKYLVKFKDVKFFNYSHINRYYNIDSTKHLSVCHHEKTENCTKITHCIKKCIACFFITFILIFIIFERFFYIYPNHKYKNDKF